MYLQNLLLSSRCGFVVEGLPSIFKALSLISSTTRSFRITIEYY